MISKELEQTVDNILAIIKKLEYEIQAIKNLLIFIKGKDNTYTLISWPESQEYMNEDWFDEEAVLHLEQASCYFIPTIRLK